jgi:hypothetical protein
MKLIYEFAPANLVFVSHFECQLVAHLYGPAARCKAKMMKVGLALLYPAH